MEDDKKLFVYLQSRMMPAHTPVPHRVMEKPVDIEDSPFIVQLIHLAYEGMEDSDGNSRWEVDVKKMVGTVICVRKVTINYLRKRLMACMKYGFVEYANEEKDSFIVKLNMKNLFKEDMEIACREAP